MAINYSDHLLKYGTKKTSFLKFMRMPFLTGFISCVHFRKTGIRENKLFGNFLKGEL